MSQIPRFLDLNDCDENEIYDLPSWGLPGFRYRSFSVVNPCHPRNYPRKLRRQ